MQENTTQENTDTLPQFETSDRCVSPADLFVSKKFASFMDLYNRKNKTNFFVTDIINNYELACDVWRFAQTCNVAGGSPMRVAADICSLVEEILAEVKTRDKSKKKK